MLQLDMRVHCDSNSSSLKFYQKCNDIVHACILTISVLPGNKTNKVWMASSDLIVQVKLKFNSKCDGHTGSTK